MASYISITKGPTPPCQYFNLDEPATCDHWSPGCGFPLTDGTPVSYPYCNMLGTDVGCDKYNASGAGSGTQPMCTLPDPSRHVCNRKTGEKWVVMDQTGTWDFDVITGWNGGDCDGSGTNIECSGYSPYHMGFGSLLPANSELLDTGKPTSFSKRIEFTSRLPLNYIICIIRTQVTLI